MKPKATKESRKAALPPMPQRRLLPEHSASHSPKVADNLDRHEFTLQTTITTLILQYELDEHGYHHGGLNE